MARRRDVIAGIIIVVAFVCAGAIFMLMMAAFLTQDDGLEFAAWGGDIGVIEVFGIMTESTGRPLIRQLDRWKDNNSIQGIILHINSAGGGAAISQELHDAVRRTAEQKPVVASIASVGASGGYYIACGADRIIANPSTLVGSIGVIMSFHTMAELLDKIGVSTETIKSGEMKDVGSYARGMTKKEELMLQSVVMDAYEQFVEAVSEGRGMDKEEIYPVADGSIFTGLQAYNLGLIDTLGGFNEAVELAAELAGIEGEPKLIRPYKKREITLFDLLGNLFWGIGGSLVQQPEGPELLYLYQ